MSYAIPPRPSNPVPPSPLDSEYSPLPSPRKIAPLPTARGGKRGRSESPSPSLRSNRVTKRAKESQASPVVLITATPQPKEPRERHDPSSASTLHDTPGPTPTGIPAPVFRHKKPRTSDSSSMSAASFATDDLSFDLSLKSKSNVMGNPFPIRSSTDLVLRSEEVDSEVRFYVDSSTVFARSPVLREIVGDLKDWVTDDYDRPVATIPESTETLEILLRFIYPKARKPVVTVVEQLDEYLGLCKLYQVESAVHSLCTAVLLSLARKEPLKAYGVACHHGLSEEMRLISRETLTVDLLKADLTGDLAMCQPQQVKKLVQLHSKRGAAATTIITQASTEEFTCTGNYCESGVAEWWLEFVKRSKVELKSKPTTEGLFSSAFLTGCCRVAGKRCNGCLEQFMSVRAQHKLGWLKDEIDALPSCL